MEFDTKFLWVTILLYICILSQSGYSMKFLAEHCESQLAKDSKPTQIECEMTSDGDNIEQFSFVIQMKNDENTFKTISKTLDKDTGIGSLKGNWDCQDCEKSESPFKLDVRLYKYDRPDMTLRVVFPDGIFQVQGDDLLRFT
jgi:hypothetical protein